MLKKYTGQTPRPPVAQIEVYGGASIYQYVNAFTDTNTSTGQSFHCRPSYWFMPRGTASWFSCKLPDNNLAMGSMCLTDSEVFKTMEQTSVFIWDTTNLSLQTIAIPTDLGYTMPPNNDGITSGASVDDVVTVNIGGTDYIYACIPIPYGGWRISTYGTMPTLAAFKKVAGVWTYDVTMSYTSNQLAASSAAGAAAIPAKTNSFGETYYDPLGPVEMEVMPVSGHLVMTRYFYRGSQHSGSIMAVNPATGVVTGWVELPDTVAVGGTNINLSPRGLTADPNGIADDERMMMVTDTFNRDAGNARYQPCMFDYSYKSSTGDFTLKSNPIAPVTPANQSYFNTFNLTGFDTTGNAWFQTSGGAGLQVFASHDLNIFKKTGAGWPTFDAAGPSANWWNNVAYPTYINGDFRLGSFATAGSFTISQGFDQSINFDNTNNRMIVTSLGGNLFAATLDASPVVGPERLANTDFSVDTSDWNGFFTSTLTRVADADFASGFCAEAVPIGAATQNLWACTFATVTPYRNYIASCYVKAVTTPRVCKISLLFTDANGNLLGTNTAPVEQTDTTTGITYIEAFGAAPATAANGFILVSAADVVAGEAHRMSSASWKEEPATATPVVNINKAHLTGVPPTQNNKGAIIGSRLYTSLQSTNGNTTTSKLQNLPQQIMSIDLNVFS